MQKVGMNIFDFFVWKCYFFVAITYSYFFLLQNQLRAINSPDRERFSSRKNHELFIIAVLCKGGKNVRTYGDKSFDKALLLRCIWWRLYFAVVILIRNEARSGWAEWLLFLLKIRASKWWGKLSKRTFRPSSFKCFTIRFAATTCWFVILPVRLANLFTNSTCSNAFAVFLGKFPN